MEPADRNIIEQNYQRHYEKVQQIAAMVAEFAKNAQPGDYFSLKKASVSHMVPQADNPRHSDKRINVSKLTEILEIDPANRICIAESGVTFQKLVRATLKHNLIPMCVSELKTITIGGAVAGCSVESMSYKYGGFYDSCVEFEVITGNGEIIECSQSLEKDLFEMIHGSFGTLGILTCLKFRLLPAKPFVRLNYNAYPTFSALMDAVEGHYKTKDVDFMDAIVHGQDKCVLCIGSLVDSAPYDHTYYYNIYYQSTLERKVDYMVTEEYFFRYDTECHWCSRNLGLENKFLRFTLGSFVLGSSNLLHLAEKFPAFVKQVDPPDVVVDVFIPFQNMAKFWDWYVKNFNYFPLWIVPYKIETPYPWINPALQKGIQGQLYIDCAIYAFRQKKGGPNYYKLLEEKVFELQGIKTLITHNFYNETMFWSTFNKPIYEKVKARSDPKNLFRELYRKTNYN